MSEPSSVPVPSAAVPSRNVTVPAAHAGPLRQHADSRREGHCLAKARRVGGRTEDWWSWWPRRRRRCETEDRADSSCLIGLVATARK